MLRGIVSTLKLVRFGSAVPAAEQHGQRPQLTLYSNPQTPRAISTPIGKLAVVLGDGLKPRTYQMLTPPQAKRTFQFPAAAL